MIEGATVRSFMGIELGSTRIKAVLIDEEGKLLASGGYDWENRFEAGMWTYALEDVWTGLRESFATLSADFGAKRAAGAGGADSSFPEISCVGVSAMMHGYLAFDKNDNQLAEFRTWRNTITEEAAEKLTEEFRFNIPQRWSIAHLYRAVAGGEAHVKDIAFITTLAGYVHYKLTGEKVLGVGDASGMFPIDSGEVDYNAVMLGRFDRLVREHEVPWLLRDILPEVLRAGEAAGYLTEDGAKLLDPTGVLRSGIPFCPPEGDAGTGMTATNSVAPLTGNVSAGTSIFAMLVLERELSKLYPEIDMVTTPTGRPVAMVHCNNCTSDLDAWIGVFSDVAALMDARRDKAEMYESLYKAALRGEPDCGGLVSVNYLSGEHTTGFHEGRPLFLRTQESSLTLTNFMRSLLFSAIATLKIGVDLLAEGEGVRAGSLLGHGGLFKTAAVAQKLLAGALDTPVSVMESAGEGGAWGIALLAAYSVCGESGETLEDFLGKRIFAGSGVVTIEPDQSDVRGFKIYLERYKAALVVEREAVKALRNRN